MDANKIGKFISVLRKEKGLTQSALAEKLNISNRTVSKWENGDGYPDITILPELARIFGVSVDEIIRGERAESFDSANQTKFEAVFTDSKKQWMKTFKCIFDSASKQGVPHIVALLSGLLIYLIARTNIFKIDLVFVINMYKWLGIFLIVFAVLLMLLPVFQASAHMRKIKLTYQGIPQKHCKFADKIYLEMGDDARGSMYYHYEDITKFIIDEDLYIIVFNKKVFLYIPKNSIEENKQGEFESLIASCSKDVYDTSTRKKVKKVFKILYIALIFVTLAIFGFYHYVSSPDYFYTKLYDKQQYYFDNKVEFNRGLDNVKSDIEIQKEVEEEGNAAYYGDKFITLDKISDVEITTESVCFDSYNDEDIYSGYVYFEGEGIPTPKDMNFYEGELDKTEPTFIEEDNVYLIGKDKNGSLTKNEWFLVMPLEDNWYYCECH